MKKFELIFASILVPLDYLALLLSGTIAYFLRFESAITELRPVIFSLTYQDFFKIMSLAAFIWLIVFSLNGLYSLSRQNFLNHFVKIIVACSAATLLIVVAFFFNFQLFSSRLIILTSWLLSIIIISLERYFVYRIKKIFYKKGIGCRKIIIIGQGKNCDDIIKEYDNNPSFGFKIIKVYNYFSAITAEDIKQQLTSGLGIDDIILANAETSEANKSELINFCLENQLNYKYTASLTQTKLFNFEVSTVAGIPLIEVKQTKLEGWGRIVKRLGDLIFSAIIIIVLAPIFIIIDLLVKLTSTGPAIVKLKRIGYSAKPFNLYKFRSMVVGAHLLKPKLMEYNERKDGPLFKMESDPRITKFGKFIRRWSLDELPQLFNILFGQMSFVGPRPHEPEEVAKYQSSHKRLLYIKPGLTGLAQVSGRSDLSWEEEVRLDTYYLENWSLGVDWQIILKTPLAVIGRRKAA